MSPFSQTSFAA